MLRGSHSLTPRAASESLLFGAEPLHVGEKGEIAQRAGDVVIVGEGGLEEAGRAGWVGRIAALLAGFRVTPRTNYGTVACA